MRYKSKDWGALAILIKPSTYQILILLKETPCKWIEIKNETNLSDPGLFRALKELSKMGLVQKSSSAHTAKYELTLIASSENIVFKLENLKASLELIKEKDQTCKEII